MKKFLQKMTIAAAVLMLCTAAVGVSAAEIVDEGSYQNDSVKWTLDDEGLLTVYGEEAYEERISADQVYLEPETASWGIGRTDIKTVVIRDGVLRIPDSAFNGCVNLESIEISGTVTSIGNNAFDGCAALKTITIPASVRSIGSCPFRGCTSLTAITAEEGSPHFYSDENGVLYVGSDGIPSGILAYPAANPAKEYVFPETVRTVNSYAFAEARYLESMTLSGRVDWILEYAFQNCTALTGVNVPEDLAVHCTFTAFDGCTSLDPAFIEEFCWDQTFYDVRPEDEYFNAVKFVNKAGLFLGRSDDDFGSADTMTRAMFVTVLGRLAGVTEVQEVHNKDGVLCTEWMLANGQWGGIAEAKTFTDVEDGQWYTDYVHWAAALGILQGYGDGTFGVNDSVTIEQAAVILARYAGLVEIPAYDMEGDYTDADEISDWAMDAMRWGTAKGIYEGYDGELRPKQNAPRALVAEMLYNYVHETDAPKEPAAEKKISEVENPDWGLTLTASDVTPTGMTLTFTQSGGNVTGRLQMDSTYFLEVEKNGNWVPVEYFDDIIVEWSDVTIFPPRNDTVEDAFSWKMLYGELPAGEYRYVKEIIDFRSADDYDTATFYAEFTVLENNVPSAKLDGFSHTELEQASVTYPGGKEVEVERDYIALFVNGSVAECEDVYLQDDVPVVPAKLVCSALGIPYDANTMTEEMRADTLAETLGAEYRYFDTTDRKEPYLYLSGKHVMIDKFDDTLTAKTAEEAAAHLKEVLITAYETRFGEDFVPAESVVEGPAAPQNEQEWHRDHITAIDADDISFELGRYYMIPYVWDFYVDKYTDDVYMMYNGIVNQITKYDPMSDGALTFAG